jgi:hypothetical protein
MRIALREAKIDPNQSFDVGTLVVKLYQLGKISWNSLDVWNHMERSSGPVDGFIENETFHYREDFEKVINMIDDEIEDEETAAILLIHRLLNEELRFMREEQG